MNISDALRHYRDGWARSDRMLRRVYNKLGPKMVVSSKSKRAVRGRKVIIFPSGKFAAMTRNQIDERWDFPDRHFMHAIAKTLEHD